MPAPTMLLVGRAAPLQKRPSASPWGNKFRVGKFGRTEATKTAQQGPHSRPAQASSLCTMPMRLPKRLNPRQAVIEIVSEHGLRDAARAAWTARSRSQFMQDMHNEKRLQQRSLLHRQPSVHSDQPPSLELSPHGGPRHRPHCRSRAGISHGGV